ncbi:hypothetical protein EV356DRAFT_566570 [Viridothelium virens]|uniref:Uncharacterized protein n=1 Tax=Viridothelium virens TaxID=1048519 RepID=A0A6A6HAU6_VIRVR|nr:hypothetical protein EV356DRAFT_566570 [Viridothelium virens]
MEAIAAAASVAGLLSLVAQCAIAHETTEADGSLDIASLQIQLEDCLGDISSWIKTARDIRPSSSPGANSWFRRFWVAVNKESVSNIRQEISRRRIEISTSLLILSNTREIRGFRTVERVEAKVDEGLSHSSNIGNVLQCLRNLDATAQTILSNSEGSMESLQSVCSSMSRFSGHRNRDPLTNEVVSPGHDECWAPRGRLSRNQSASGSSTSFSAGSNMSTGILRPGPRLGSRERKAIDMLNIRPRDYIPNPAGERHGFAEDPDKEMDNSWWHLDEHDHHNEESPSTFHTRQYQFNADVQVDEEVKHFNRFLWSCRALRTFEMALYSSNRKLLCAYCGTLMGWQIHENTKVRQRVRGQSHLRMVHRFGECNQQNTYASKKDFYQHLVDFHAASVSGAWIITLDNACAFELPGSAKALFSAVASSLNFTTAKLEKLWDTFKPPSNQHFSSRTKSAIVNYLLRGPYDDLSFAQLISQMRLAALCKDEIHLLNLVLSNWPLEHGETINSVARSMLMQRRIDLKMIRTGILKTTAADARREPQSSNEKEKNILRQWERTLGEKSMDEFRESSANFAIRLQSYNDSLLSTWTGSRDRVNRWLLHTLGSSAEQANIHLSMMHDPKTSMKYWSRLVLKYWFLDEAALGIEFEPSPSLGAAHSPDSSSLWSSEFASCKSHLTEAVVLREDEEHGRECATGQH